MKKEFVATATLVIIGIFAVLNLSVVPAGICEQWPVSDKVTMSNPHGLTPGQQQQGIKALQGLV